MLRVLSAAADDFVAGITGLSVKMAESCGPTAAFARSVPGMRGSGDRMVRDVAAGARAKPRGA
jgi:hypothetical protein